jgi:hypothetical protein
MLRAAIFYMKTEPQTDSKILMYYINRLWKMSKQNTSMNVEIYIHEVKNYKIFIYGADQRF